MKVFYDSTDNNQVQAVYTGDTNSTAWDTFDNIEVDDPDREAELLQYGRDCRLTIVDSAVTAVTPHEHPVDHTLDIHKHDKTHTIDARSRELVTQGFGYDGNTYSLSEQSQLKLLGLRVAAITGTLVDPDNYPIPFACTNECAHYITDEAYLFAMFNTGFARMHYIMATGAALKDACMAAADQAALDAIVDTRE